MAFVARAVKALLRMVQEQSAGAKDKPAEGEIKYSGRKAPTMTAATQATDAKEEAIFSTLPTPVQMTSDPAGCKDGKVPDKLAVVTDVALMVDGEDDVVAADEDADAVGDVFFGAPPAGFDWGGLY